MAAERFHVEPLNATHDGVGFASGFAALGRYCHEQIGQDVRRRLAAAFVLVDSAATAPAGFYTLSSLSLRAEHVPEGVRKRLAGYPSLPGILIGRLAIDERYQGQGLGTRLLKDALRRSLEASREVGAFAVVVQAKDEAARCFYVRYGFIQLLDNEFRLFLPMSTIDQALS